jgi:hypothetical protein
MTKLTRRSVLTGTLALTAAPSAFGGAHWANGCLWHIPAKPVASNQGKARERAPIVYRSRADLVFSRGPGDGDGCVCRDRTVPGDRRVRAAPGAFPDKTTPSQGQGFRATGAPDVVHDGFPTRATSDSGSSTSSIQSCRFASGCFFSRGVRNSGNENAPSSLGLRDVL